MTRTALLSFGLILACVPLSGCHQERGAGHRAERHGDETAAPADRSASQATEPEEGRGRGHGLRRACAEDLEKYCAGQDRRRERRECLQNHVDQLSADCKAALNERGQHRHRRD